MDVRAPLSLASRVLAGTIGRLALRVLIQPARRKKDGLGPVVDGQLAEDGGHVVLHPLKGYGCRSAHSQRGRSGRGCR
jgi:hypothetical protein